MEGHLVTCILVLALTAGAISEDIFEEHLRSRIRKSATVDFDEWARQFVQNKANENGRYVSWWDLYGNHIHLRERPQYHKYRIHVDVSNIRYGQPNSDIERPNVVYTKRWENRMSTPMKVKISKEIQRANVYSWTVMKGINMRYDVKAPGEKPGLFGGKKEESNSTEVSLKKQETQSQTEVETLKMEYDLVVKPDTYVKAEWVLTEKEVEVPWEADVYIDGWVAVWYSEKFDGHWLWFYPIHFLASPVFRQQGNGLVYKASGTFRGIQGIDSNLKTREFPVEQECVEGSCSQSTQVSIIPLEYIVTGLTLYQP